MRTTLDLDEQVLAVARSLATSRRISLGQAVSDLARRGIRADAPGLGADFAYSPFPVIVGDSDVLVSDELIAELRDA
ncbi:MAG: DUF2191 domain-containing protein [Tetrasphaera sp.]|jgi:hypothetical protein|nr:DUF2191 domain-containing protein [Tetrasphaera sp.]